MTVRTINYPLIAEALMEFEFGATIEVTNGLSNGYSGKAKQANRARDFLFHLAEKRADIATGVAYLAKKTPAEHSNDVNVLITVAKYSLQRLRTSLEKTLDITDDTEKGEAIERMLRKSDQDEWLLPGFITGSDQELKRHARYLGILPERYLKLLGELKGFIMEFYIQSLFDEQLAEKCIFHRVIYSYNNENNRRTRSDADVVVACRKAPFFNAIGRMNREPHIQVTVLRTKY